MDYKYDIFISYSRKDIAIADQICAALEKNGISFFIDRKGIGGGMEFPSLLAESIQASKIMLFLASTNSYNSKFTKKEVTFAFNEKPSGSLLPYIIDGSELPTYLRFTFSDINIRTIEEHPIDTILMRDLCQLLGYPYKTDEERDEEKKQAEEEYRAKIEQEYQLRMEEKEKELQRKLEEYRKKEPLATDHHEEKPDDDAPTKTLTPGTGWAMLAFFAPLLTLALGIYYGIRQDSFWLGAEIFLIPGWVAFWLFLQLSDKNKANGKHLGLGLALFGVAVAAGIHSGMYFASPIIGVIVGLALACAALYIAFKDL